MPREAGFCHLVEKQPIPHSKVVWAGNCTLSFHFSNNRFTPTFYPLHLVAMVVEVRQCVVDVGEVEFETVGNLGWRQLSVFDERVNSPDGYPVPGDVRLVHQVGRDAPRVTCHLGVTLFGLVYEPSDARSRPSYNACLR